jgi:hypothetical protein
VGAGRQPEALVLGAGLPGERGDNQQRNVEPWRVVREPILEADDEQGELIASRLADRPPDENPWASLRAAFQVLEEIEATRERRLELITLLFSNESLRAGHAEKQARWQDLLAPLIEPRLPNSDHRALEARANAAAAISCLQAANEEWARLSGQAEIFDLYDTAVRAIRRDA